MNDAIMHNVFASLDIMWKGMLGLFIVCTAVAVITGIIARLTRPKGT
jgi:hypothetical protein